MKYSKKIKNEAVMLFYFVRIVESSELIIYTSRNPSNPEDWCQDP